MGFTLRRWLLLLLVLALCYGGSSVAQNAARRRVSRPNLNIHTYRRCSTPDEKIVLNLAVYNERAVAFTLYRLDLPALIPTSKALEEFGKRIMSVDVRRLPVVRTWKYAIDSTYPDQWAERQVPLEHLTPGVYLVRVQGGGVEKRTWLAVTQIALLAKRSRQELLIYAAQAHSGQPVGDLPLVITDSAGRRTARDHRRAWPLSPETDGESGQCLDLRHEERIAGFCPSGRAACAGTLHGLSGHRPAHLSSHA